MDSFVVAFIRSSLLWLACGAALGVWMTFDPQATVYRAAHMHANLLGFVSMMIFGVAYHVIPRFSGNPLHSRRIAHAHLWLANAGLLGMVAGFMIRVADAQAGVLMLRAGAVTSAVGILFFITNIWKTIGRPGVAAISRSPRLKFSAEAGK